MPRYRSTKRSTPRDCRRPSVLVVPSRHPQVVMRPAHKSAQHQGVMRLARPRELAAPARSRRPAERMQGPSARPRGAASRQKRDSGACFPCPSGSPTPTIGATPTASNGQTGSRSPNSNGSGNSGGSSAGTRGSGAPNASPLGSLPAQVQRIDAGVASALGLNTGILLPLILFLLAGLAVWSLLRLAYFATRSRRRSAAA